MGLRFVRDDRAFGRLRLFLHCLFNLHCSYKFTDDNGSCKERGCADCEAIYWRR